MELHPILDSWPPPSAPLTPHLWYVISSTETTSKNDGSNDKSHSEHRSNDKSLSEHGSYNNSRSEQGSDDAEGCADSGVPGSNGAVLVSPSPSARVGVTASFDAESGVVHVIGGADPSGAHDDVYELRLKEDFRWNKAKTKGGFKARYEHAAFRLGNWND